MESLNNIEARNRLGAGRIIAKNMKPYFSRGLDSIELVEKHGTGRITVDKYWRLYYDPEYCLQLTARELASEWLHNINHLFRGHPQRFEEIDDVDKNRADFNFAADAIINTELRSEGVIMPNPENKPYLESGREMGWRSGMAVEQLYYLTAQYKSSQSDSEGLGNEEGGTGQNPPENSSEADTEPPSDVNEQEEQVASEPSDSATSNSDENESDGSNSEDNSAPVGSDENSEDYDTGENPDSSNNAESGEESSTPSSGDDNESNSSGSPKQGEPTQTNENDGGESESSVPNSPSDSNSGELENIGEPHQEESQSDDSTDGISLEDDPDGVGKQKGHNNKEQQEKTTTEREYINADPEEHGEDTTANHNPDDHDCGSGAGGEPREWENAPDEKAIDPTSSELIKDQIAREILNHEQGNPGSIPGGLIRDAKVVLEPENDWIKEFINLINKAIGASYGKIDQTYSRMSKKQSSTNSIILPGWQSPDPIEVGAIIDTSGSMEEKTDIALALGLMEDLMKTFGQESARRGIYLISCDAEATVSFAESLETAQLVGGGDTDMRIGIKAAAEIKPPLDVIITITDGGTPWPKEIPYENRGAKYIALIVGEPAKRVPDWMHVIEVKIPRSRSQFKAYK